MGKPELVCFLQLDKIQHFIYWTSADKLLFIYEGPGYFSSIYLRSYSQGEHFNSQPNWPLHTTLTAIKYNWTRSKNITEIFVKTLAYYQAVCFHKCAETYCSLETFPNWKLHNFF